MSANSTTISTIGGRARRSSDTNQAALGVGILAAMLGAAAIAFGPIQATLVCVCGAIVVFAALERPEFAIAALVLTIPLQAVWAVRLGGVELTWTKVALGAVVIGWSARWLIEPRALRADSIGFALAVFSIALLLSANELTSWTTFLGEAYRWSVVLVLYVIVHDLVSSGLDVTVIVWSVATSLLVTSAVAAWQVMAGSGPTSFAVNGSVRAYGAFGAPNPFAIYLEMSTLFIAAFLLLALSGDRSRFDLTVIGLCISTLAGTAAVVLTQSRGGILGLTAGLFVLFWWYVPRGRTSVAVAAGAVALTIGLGFGGIPALERFDPSGLTGASQPLVTTANFAVQERIAHWGAAMAMWREFPIFGVGAGSFSEHFRDTTPDWRFRISRGHAHSSYLQAASQLGTVGILAYLGLLATAIVTCARRAAVAVHLRARAATIGALTVTVALAVHGLFDYVHVLSLGLLLSVLWGLSATSDGSGGTVTPKATTR